MTAFIFVFGLVVTLVAGGAVATIWWAALRDGEVDGDLERGRPTDFHEPAVAPAVAPAAAPSRSGAGG